MKRKGFTLIEMLVVLILIAIILLIAIPSVIKLRESQSNKEYDIHIKLVRQALDTYTIKYQSKIKQYNTEGKECISMPYKMLENTLKKDNMSCSGFIIMYPLSNGSYRYDLDNLACGKAGVNNQLQLGEGNSTSNSGCFDLETMVSSDNTLDLLEIEGYTLQPTFDPNVTKYNLTVESSSVNLKVKAKTADDKSTVRIIGNTGLKAGNNTIVVRVSAENGDKREYEINVFKKQGTTASIKEISSDDCEFTVTGDIYSCSVKNTVLFTNITALADEETMKVEGTGVKTLKVGLNEFEIVVKSEDENEEKSYVLRITREASNINALSSLSADVCEIDFNSNITSYVCEVENHVNKMVISPTSANNEATITINGEVVSSTKEVDLLTGVHDIVIKVTAGNGDELEYTIRVNRLKNNDATLASIDVAGCVLNPTFNKDVTVYSCSDNYESDIKQIEINATKTKDESTVTGLGIKDLTVEGNAYEINVVAEDGVTTKTYTLFANRKASTNVYLKSLSITNHELDKAFNKEEKNYKIIVNSDETDVQLNFETENGDSRVEVNGVANTSNEVAISNLVSGDNYTTVRVIAEDQITVEEYIINVYKESGDATLSSIDIPGCVISPQFNSNVLSYTCDVRYNIDALEISATTTHDKATIISGTGSNPIDFGTTTYSIDVKAEDSRYTKTYKIVATKTKDSRNTLDNLELLGYTILDENDQEFSSSVLEYYVGVEDDAITIEANATSEVIQGIIGTGVHHIGNEETKVFPIIVTSQNGDTLTYSITVTNTMPLPPVIGEVDNAPSWYRAPAKVEVKTEGIAMSGINYYEYFVTSDETLVPNSETDATGIIGSVLAELDEDETPISPDLYLDNDGTWYVYYRTVSNNINRSVWSNRLVLKIDQTGPTPPQFVSSTSPSWSSITANYGTSTSLSGIKGYKCYYGTSENTVTSEGTLLDNNCSFTGLSQNTTYYFKKCAISNSDVEICSAINSQTTLRRYFTVTVENGTFLDGTTSKQVAQDDSVTATRNNDALPSSTWLGYTNYGSSGRVRKDQYRTCSWDSADTSKTITVTGNATISFTYSCPITNTRYMYQVRFYDGSTEYTAKRTWTAEGGNRTFTFPSAPTKTDYNFVGWNTSSTATTGYSAGSTGTVSSGATSAPNYYAIWELSTIYARDLDYSNTTYTTCTQAQCAIDELANLLR